MTDRDNEIRERCEAATPGPWDWRYSDKNKYSVEAEALTNVIYLEDDYPGYPECGEHLIMNIETPDADFIAASRTDIPYLLDRVVELEKEIAAAHDREDAAYAELERLREAQRWIPCEERLPEEDGRYLCAMDRVAPEYLGGCDREVRIMRLTGTMWRIPRHIPNWINGEIIDKVTHWRTLPALPKEG